MQSGFILLGHLLTHLSEAWAEPLLLCNCRETGLLWRNRDCMGVLVGWGGAGLNWPWATPPSLLDQRALLKNTPTHREDNACKLCHSAPASPAHKDHPLPRNNHYQGTPFTKDHPLPSITLYQGTTITREQPLPRNNHYQGTPFTKHHPLPRITLYQGTPITKDHPLPRITLYQGSPFTKEHPLPRQSHR